MKSILITGVSRGLGKALFKLFISKNYLVFGVLRNRLEAENLEKTLPENAKLIITDLSNEDSIASIKAKVGDVPIDLLINNAGIGGGADKLDELESEEILRLFNIHCLGVIRTVKALKENMLKAPDPIVINMNSRLGSITRQGDGTYGHIEVSYSYRIAKASQNMLTNCLRKEFKNAIKFISLHPGKMKTAIAQPAADIYPEEVAAKILEFNENEKFQEENGIVELDRKLIEW